MKFFYFLLISVFFISSSVYSNDAEQGGVKLKRSILGKRKPRTASEKVIYGIEKVVVNFIREGKDITDKNVRDTILHQVNSMYPLNKNVKIEKINILKIEKDADLEAQKKYAFTRQDLRKKYTEEADKKFKAATVNSKVTVEFRQGPYIRKISGIYYGLNFEHSGIRVGRRLIPLVDLLPEAKVQFDNKYREQQKEDYINEHIAKDLSLKGNYAMSKVTKAVKSVIKQNEDAGYIYTWGKWRTPTEIAEIIIKYYSRK